MWGITKAGVASDSYLGADWGSSSEVVMVGRNFFDGVVVYSLDRGSTWDRVVFEGDTLADVAAIAGTEGTYFIAAANSGGIYYSTDYGATWTYADTIIPAYLYGVGVGSNEKAYAVGQVGTVYVANSSTSFAVWEDVSVPGTTRQLNDVSSFDGVTVYVVGNTGTIYKSADGGASWTQCTSGTTNHIYSISQASNNVAMVTGAENYAARTLDGGATWTTMSVFSSGSTTAARVPHVVSMLTTTVAYMASVAGGIYRTVDGGNSWKVENTAESGQSIFSLQIYSTDVGIAGDAFGNAYVLSPAMPTSVE